MRTPDPSPAPSGLVATLGRWDLATLVVNTVVGGGIFGLPMLVAQLLGASSFVGYLAAAAGIGVLVLCFAEVSAQFRSAGGPYLYAREAFGPFVGLQVGWVTWLMRISATGANANLFVGYLGTVWAPVAIAPVRWTVITALFAVPAIVNIRGVKQGATTSNVLVAAKLVPLFVFVGVGLFFIHPGTVASWPPAGPGHWFRAVLLLVFAFGGFDNAVLPASEMRDPARDAPFALLTGMSLVTILYLLIQVVFQGTVSAGTVTDQPLATAAGRFLGAPGVWLMAVGAMVSVWGWFAATMLGTPRLTFALGERGDFPRVFARVHPRFRTPYVSILCYAGLGWVLALSGSFEWNASLSAVARLFTYGVTCGALPVFRRRNPGAAVFRTPAGYLMPALGVAFCVVLLTQMGSLDFTILAATMALAAATWVWARRRG
jgi:APA family basic amino acid/polyamine antiporter